MDDSQVGEPLVRSLLHDQHPDLADLPLHPVAAGWDNQMWRLGEDLAVRIPRTSRAPSLLRNELRWLPDLAERSPLALPTPVRVGEPSSRFPRPWLIVAWVHGEPGDRAPITHAPDAADRLAGFLDALHLKAPNEAPRNPVRGVPLDVLAEKFHTRLEAVAPLVDAVAARAVWDDAASAPGWEGPPLWLHGDLHPANVVVADGTLGGVIDFGELCAGDPATDLAAAWTLLPVGAVPRFFAAYASADHATVRRARGWAALVGIGMVGIGQAWDRGRPGGQPTWGAAGRRILERILT